MFDDRIDRLNSALEGRYRIERELGHGGMATVYLTDDLRHARKVALKVLKPELASVVGGDRFLAEIRTTANLQHPHILALFDSGEADGLPFYVMPLVEGESLKERLEREGPLPVDEAIRIAAECGEALDHAHRQAVVHRDVKPANILLSGSHALLADFGVATAVDEATGREALTATGVTVGTLGYMSPEQASGEHPTDVRSDVYALGCVLYEMLAGERPFEGATPYAVMARQMEGPGPITTVRRSVPASVEHAIGKACEPTPADRFQSAAEFTRALRASSEPLPARSAGRQRPRWLLPAAIAAVIATASAWFGASRQTDEAAAVIGPAVPLLAVRPFENLSPAEDDAFFADGTHQAVQAQLSKLSGLTVLAREAVTPYRDASVPAAEIARDLGATAVLGASVTRASDQVRVVAQLVDPATGGIVWAETYTKRLDATNVFEVQAEIALRVAEALEVTLSPEEEDRIARRPTGSLAAYDLFLKGEQTYPGPDISDNEEAIRFYREALAIDPDYAPAHAGLGKSFAKKIWAFGEPLQWGDSAIGYGRRAIELDAQLPLGHSALAVGYSVQERRELAIEGHREAIALDPNAFISMVNLGFELQDVGRFDEALPWLHRAVVLDPTQGIPRQNLVDVYRSLLMDRVADEWMASLITLGSPALRIRRAHQAREQGDTAQALALAAAQVTNADEGREDGARVYAAEVAYLARDFDQAATWAVEATRLTESPDNVHRNSWYGLPVLLGLALAGAGDLERGRDVLEQAIDQYTGRIEGGADYWLFPWGIGVAHAALGNDAAALEWLDRAYDAGFRRLRLARDEPTLDRLRSEGALQEWMTRIESDVAEMRARAVEHDRQAGLR